MHHPHTRLHSKQGLVSQAGGVLPVDGVGVENVNVSRLITGHNQYMECMEEVLEAVGVQEGVR